jgi:hypothetical protein
MCGCPIAPTTDWKPEEFDVTAAIEGEGYSEEFTLTFDEHAPFGMPSQFTHIWQVPKNTTGQLEIYAITVAAFQRRTGNTGVDRATIIIPAAVSPHGSQS